MTEIIMNLPPRQVKALVSLATGSTKIEAAKVAGVDPSTIHRWLKHEDFQAGLREVNNVHLQDTLAAARQKIWESMKLEPPEN